jgi:hypothetical protein
MLVSVLAERRRRAELAAPHNPPPYGLPQQPYGVPPQYGQPQYDPPQPLPSEAAASSPDAPPSPFAPPG